MSQAGTDVAAEHGIPRSIHWPLAERRFKASAMCPPCGEKVYIQVHHRAPFHYVVFLGRPDLELDPRNFRGVCENEGGHVTCDHHILLAHLRNFKSANLDLDNALVIFKGMTEAEIIADPRFIAMEANKLKQLNLMTDQDKTDFRAWLDKEYPLPEGVTPEMALQSIIDGLKKGG